MQTSQPIQKRFKQDQGGAEADQARGRAQLVHVSHAEAEPEEVDHHEGEERHAVDRQVQLARGSRVVDGDVPRAPHRHHGVQHRRKQDALLNDVRVEAEADPVEVDASVAVEVIRSCRRRGARCSRVELAALDVAQALVQRSAQWRRPMAPSAAPMAPSAAARARGACRRRTRPGPIYIYIYIYIYIHRYMCIYV